MFPINCSQWEHFRKKYNILGSNFGNIFILLNPKITGQSVQRQRRSRSNGTMTPIPECLNCNVSNSYRFVRLYCIYMSFPKFIGLAKKGVFFKKRSVTTRKYGSQCPEEAAKPRRCDRDPYTRVS